MHAYRPAMVCDRNHPSPEFSRRVLAKTRIWDRVAMTRQEDWSQTWLWFDIDLGAVPDYTTWKPESLGWALTVDCAKVNGLVRNNLEQYPTDDHAAAMRSGRAAGLSPLDLDGLWSLCAEPLYATAPQITAGGHRIAAMRTQGVRWALGQCDRDAVGDGTIDELHVYLP